MRIRTVKPEFWHDEELSEVSEAAALLAIGLLNYADDEGWFKAHPGLIKASLFPLREPSVSVQNMLTELASIGYITLYKCGKGKPYGLINGFKDHQRINRATESKIKDLEGLTELSVSDHVGVNAGKEQGKERNREQGTEQGDMSNAVAPDEPVEPDPVALIFEHWQRAHDHPKAKLDDKRRKLINRALKLGYTANDLKLAISGCAKSPFHMGDNDGGTRYDGLDLILRDASKIDQFISIYHNPPKPRGKQGRIEAINQQAVEDFLSGDDPFAPPSDDPITAEYTVED